MDTVQASVMDASKRANTAALQVLMGGGKPVVDSGMSPRSDALQSMTVWRLCGLANCGVVGCLVQDGYSWIGIELGNRFRIQSLKVGDCIGSADGRQNRSVGILRISVALRE